MRFWDSSALVPLLVAEELSPSIRNLHKAEKGLVAWWASEVECASAIARLEHQGGLSTSDATEAYSRLRALARSWHTIEPVGAVREAAIRFLRVHDLRAADALQLGAAFVASEGRPSTLGFVCLDDRLAGAAEREGFEVLDRSKL
ncbi:MAG: type II toxin-antitoxin system VapC family toxin [Thermoanaerobaculia bacterium]